MRGFPRSGFHLAQRTGVHADRNRALRFFLKSPLSRRLQTGDKKTEKTAGLIGINDLLDRPGFFTTDNHQRSRETIIRRQQQDLLELSPPW